MRRARRVLFCARGGVAVGGDGVLFCAWGGVEMGGGGWRGVAVTCCSARGAGDRRTEAYKASRACYCNVARVSFVWCVPLGSAVVCVRVS